jgi:hypothetical protein
MFDAQKMCPHTSNMEDFASSPTQRVHWNSLERIRTAQPNTCGKLGSHMRGRFPIKQTNAYGNHLSLLYRTDRLYRRPQGIVIFLGGGERLQSSKTRWHKNCQSNGCPQQSGLLRCSAHSPLIRFQGQASRCRVEPSEHLIFNYLEGSYFYTSKYGLC